MEKIVLYRSIDGIKFEDEEECREWEWRISHEPYSICLRDESFFPYDPETPEEVEVALDGATYIEVANVEGWDKDLDWLMEYWDFNSGGIDRPGTYQYDWDDQEWFEVSQPDLRPIEKRGD